MKNHALKPGLRVLLLGTTLIAGAAHSDPIPVSLELSSPLSSRHARRGATIELRVSQHVLDANGRVLIAQEASAKGHVVRALRSGFFGSKGRLERAFDSVVAADGSTLILRGGGQKSGGNRELLAAASLATLTPFGLLLKGGNVVLPRGFAVQGVVEGGEIAR